LVLNVISLIPKIPMKLKILPYGIPTVIPITTEKYGLNTIGSDH